MEGLDQVSDDTGCYDSPAIERPAAALRADPARSGAGVRMSRWVRIANTIEGEVVPRLLLAHRADLRPTRAGSEAVAFDGRTPERFARIVLEETDTAALEFVHDLLAGGLPLESVYLDLLTPAARYIGQQWEDDRMSFAEVTLGLARLQRLMRTLSASVQEAATVPASDHGPVIFAATPGEQHMFGVLILEEFARRAGLQVECLPACDRHELLTVVARRAPAVIGLSVSVDDRLDELRDLISDIRGRIGPRKVLVMVGGRCFNDRPEAVGEVGADLTAVDGREAILHIHDYMSKLSDTTG